jgi:hypothetical protein
MRKRSAYPALLLALVSGGICRSADAYSSGVEWNGGLETLFKTYRSRVLGLDTAQEAVVYAHFRPKMDLGERTSFKSDLLVRADAGNVSRNTVRLDEAYATIKAGSSLTFHAGKMIYSWGNDAIFNPTDFINPRDYYDFFHVDKLGVIAVDANWAITSALSFDIGIVPIFTPSIVSNPTSRWIDYTPFASQAITSQLALPGNLPTGYSVPFDLQQRNPKFPQVFARLGVKSLWIDTALSYSYRYNPYPQMVLFSSEVRFDAINGLPVGQVQGVPFYQREHLAAFDASIPIAGATLFFNSTVGIPDANQSDIPTNTEILTNFNNIGLGSHVSSTDIEEARKTSTAMATVGLRYDWSKFRIYAQFGKLWYLRGNKPTALLGTATQGVGVNPADFFDFYSGTLIPGFQVDFAKKWSLRGGAILNLTQTGAVIDAAIDYRVADGFKASLFGDYIHGKEGSLLGFWSGNSNVALGLDVAF